MARIGQPIGRTSSGGERRRTGLLLHRQGETTGARERIPQRTYVVATGYKNDAFNPIAEKLRQRTDWRVEEMPFTHDLQHVAVVETADMIESAIP